MSIKKIKNNTNVDKFWLGQLVTSGSYYQIQPEEEIDWINNSALLTDIGNAIAIVNDGNIDITDVNNSINYLKNDLPTNVKVQEEDTNNKTGGHYQACSFEITITGAPEQFTDISFPIPISLLSAEFTCDNTMSGDHTSFEIAPDTTIGVLTTSASQNDNILNVSQSVLDNIQIGYWCSVVSGSSSEDCGRVLTIDKTNKQITIENALSQNYTGTVYVKQTVKMVPHIELPGIGRVVLGESKIGGSYLPANTILRLKYKSKNGITNKIFSFRIEYLY